MPTGYANAAKWEVTFQMGRVEREVRILAAKHAETILNRMMEVAVAETESIIRREFRNDRSGRRRKGGQHLSGSIRAKVEQNGRLPQLVIWSAANAKKAGMQEYGRSTGYRIRPSDAEEGFLFFPSNKTQRPIGKKQGPIAGVKVPRAQAAYGAFRAKGKRSAVGKGELMTKTTVSARGPYAGRHYMKRGAQRALDKVLNG